MRRRPMLGTAMMLAAGPVAAQDVLPFPAPPMGGKVGPTMQESIHKWCKQPRHLPEGAPNILIVMLDDGNVKLVRGDQENVADVLDLFDKIIPARNYKVLPLED